MYEKNRAWIELNREHLLHNIKELQHLAGKRSELMPAVKADAYGHGDVLISSMLQDAGIRNYCTATVDEAVRLRQAGIQGQILILGYTHPDAFPELARYALTQTVVDTDYARELSEFSQKFSDYTDTRCPQESSAFTDAGCPQKSSHLTDAGCSQKSSALTDAGCSHESYAGMRNFPGRTQGLPGRSGRISVHIAIDTGMHRLGIPYENTDTLPSLWSLPGLEITGVFSHLCVSDGLTETEKRFTEQQIYRFRRAVDALHARGITGFQTHIQGSYGILNYSQYRFDLARPGIALYGVLSSQNDRPAADVRLAPVLSLKSRIVCIRELPAGESAGYGLAYTAQNTRRIAIVSAGYADGIPRSLSNRGHALVNGKRVPIIGRICMDQLTLDVTDVPDARRGDEVVFIGRSGDSMIRAEEMAEDAGTITNEILSRMGKRIQRLVKNN